MALKVWFEDDLKNIIASLGVATVGGNGAGPLSDYDKGRLSALMSCAVAFGLDDVRGFLLELVRREAGR